MDLYPNFCVSGCKIGLSEVLEYIYIYIYIEYMEIYYLYCLKIYHVLMLQLAIPNLFHGGASSDSNKSIFIHHEVFMLDGKS